MSDSKTASQNGGNQRKCAAPPVFEVPYDTGVIQNFIRRRQIEKSINGKGLCKSAIPMRKALDELMRSLDDQSSGN